MADRYDKPTCATDLKLRGEILAKIREGWRPAGAFELPVGDGKTEAKERSSDSETSSTSCRDPREEGITELDFATTGDTSISPGRVLTAE